MTDLSDEQAPAAELGRILIVDDNPTNIDVLFDFLSDLGYEVLVAEDGRSALERIEFAVPDVILLDIMMPHVDGFEVCRRLKENPETEDIPVMFMTALGSITDKLKGFEMGAVDYITKPFQNQEVLARVRTHITLRRMRKDLEARNEQLQAQNEALDAYARTVAHDLKNPLNLILNFARLIEEEHILEGVPAEDLHHIIISAERMNHIIHDLLLLSQMRRGQVTAVRVNMEVVVQLSLDRLERDLKEAGVELVLPDQWIDCLGVSSWLQAVWVNYMSNGIKYGGASPRLELSCEPDPDRKGFICYSVTDNGPGVPEEMMDRIFEEFARVGGEKREGHGIGLSIVRRIVERLGGEVHVGPGAGGLGSRFAFSLPEVSEA